MNVQKHVEETVFSLQNCLSRRCIVLLWLFVWWTVAVSVVSHWWERTWSTPSTSFCISPSPRGTEKPRKRRKCRHFSSKDWQNPKVNQVKEPLLFIHNLCTSAMYKLPRRLFFFFVPLYEQEVFFSLFIFYILTIQVIFDQFRQRKSNGKIVPTSKIWRYHILLLGKKLLSFMVVKGSFLCVFDNLLRKITNF